MISTGGHLTILESVDSTNNYAMAKVRTGMAKHGDGFFAMAQYGGKGQRGKRWVTAPGENIILTLVMQPSTLELTQQFQFSAAIALGVYDFFSFYAGAETAIKWPNDIYWRDRKAGGVLIENIVGSRSVVNSQESVVDSQDSVVDRLHPNLPVAGMEGEANGLPTPDSRLSTHWHWAVVGMGININQTIFLPDIAHAVSLKQITGIARNVVEMARELCTCIQKRYGQLLAGEDLLLQYNQRLFKRGQTAKFRKGSRLFEGRVMGVNIQGQLLVDTGVQEQFSFGELEWVM